MIEPTSHSVHKGTEVTINASCRRSIVRLESDGLSTAVLHIFDNRHHLSERLNFETVICLKKALDLWEKEVLPVNWHLNESEAK